MRRHRLARRSSSGRMAHARDELLSSKVLSICSAQGDIEHAPSRLHSHRTRPLFGTRTVHALASAHSSGRGAAVAHVLRPERDRSQHFPAAPPDLTVRRYSCAARWLPQWFNAAGDGLCFIVGFPVTRDVGVALRFVLYDPYVPSLCLRVSVASSERRRSDPTNESSAPAREGRVPLPARRRRPDIRYSYTVSVSNN